MTDKIGHADMTAGYSFERKDAGATPLCGAHRPVKGNPLLIKSQLGAVKASAYDLPKDFGFTYGLKMERDGLTAGSVVENWAEHTGTKDQLPARDFKALNKAAIMSGHLDAKGIRNYTKTHDIRVSHGSEGKAAPLPINENTCFGRLGRAATPVGDIISHGFRYDWVMQSPQACDLQEARKAQKPKPTKSSKLMADTAAERMANPKSLELGFAKPTPEDYTVQWKMQKFSKVQARVQMG